MPDETACNFDPVALYDDGSCQDGPAYWGENIDYEGNCLNDADGDYVCDENEIPGCLSPMAVTTLRLRLIWSLAFPRRRIGLRWQLPERCRW